MKHHSSTLKVVSIFVFIAILFMIFSFSKREAIYYNRAKTLQENTEAFNLALIDLDKTATDFKLGKTNVEALRTEAAKARLAYKKIEFYLAFYHNEFVGEHINGAPLLHIERTGTLPNIVEPEGLQVLDEMVFSEDIFEERSVVSAIATNLRSNYGILYKSLQAQPIPTDGGIEALRLGLVRIFTLGITGFDTPGSLNGLEESKVSLEGMRDYFAEHQQGSKKRKVAVVLNLFDGAILYLNEAAFEDFDRLSFFRNYLDPLYKELGNFQKKKNAPEFLSFSSAWNPQSESLFSQDFLNPFFFTELEEKEDGKKLKSLGESLFYDPLLSANQQISCASCHNPELAFTDAQPKSLSNIQGKTVLRNSPTLLNAVYADRYFYDLRAFTLEQQAEHVIFNSEEFNTAYSDILHKIKENDKYNKEFKQVFGKDKITRENLSKALASYVLSLQSFNSEFDKYARGETQEIDIKVKNGFNLFMGKANCATCHFAPTFSGLVPPFYNESESEILGVLENPQTKKIDSDQGRLANQITSEEAWIYEKSFKTTTVRNAELTAPYFHNGTYKTLEEVIDFYDQGGGEGMGLDVPNQTLGADPLNLTDKEKEELIAFIKSLSDNPFSPITDIK